MNNNLYYLLLLFITSYQTLSGQRNWEIGFNGGYVTHNALNLPDDLKEYFSTTSTALNLSLVRKHKLNGNVEIFGGIGLHSYFFEESPAYILKNDASHYYAFVYGLRRSFSGQKVSLNLFIDHNILYSGNLVQHNRVYTNINLGVSYFLSDKILLNTYVPITIYPMFSHKNVGKTEGEILTLYRSGVYNLGIYVGVSYLL